MTYGTILPGFILRPVIYVLLIVTVTSQAAHAEADTRLKANPVLPPLTVYTPANAPTTPKLADLEKKKSISQYGITWTFDRDVPVGRFISGDWYVVGPVTVVMIDPKPLFGEEVTEPLVVIGTTSEKPHAARRARNGSMVNPPPATKTSSRAGFDSRIATGRYKPELFAHLPIALKPGDVLLSSISRTFEEIGEKGFQGGWPDPIRSCAVLTVLSEPQPADAFRPSYCDTANSKQYLARNITQRGRLQSMPRLAGMPADLGTYAVKFQRPWVDLSDYGTSCALENMPHYGQTMNQDLGEATILLNMNYTAEEKERLIVNLIQVGIDRWGQTRHGYSWIADGGHYQGRKWPIVFAGLMLGDEQLTYPRKAYPKNRFEEDDQTGLCPYEYKGKVYEQCWTGAKAFYVGHSPWNTTPDEVVVGAWEIGWGPIELFHPRDWPVIKATSGVGSKGLGSYGYRMSNSSPCWVGLALGIRLMHAEKEWNMPGFCEYVDRWMNEDDSQQIEQAMAHCPWIENMYPTIKKATFGNYGRQGYVSNNSKWVKEAWLKLRDTIPVGPDGHKTPSQRESWR